MKFTCAGCGFSTPVVVKARGFATGAFAGEGLSARAQRDALFNAQMRCELTPCPRCKRRSFAALRRSLIKSYVWAAAFFVLLLIGQHATDASVFNGSYAAVAMGLYAAVALLLFGGIAIAALLEVRNAPRKVRFPST